MARVRGKVSRRALGALRQGVDLEDGLTSPAEVNLKKQSAKTALVEITIHEGRKRQVRRMFAAVGLPVEELHRRRYGPIADKGLEPGGYRELAGDEVEALRRAGEDVAVAVGGESRGPAGAARRRGVARTRAGFGSRDGRRRRGERDPSGRRRTRDAARAREPGA